MTSDVDLVLVDLPLPDSDGLGMTVAVMTDSLTHTAMWAIAPAGAASSADSLPMGVVAIVFSVCGVRPEMGQLACPPGHRALGRSAVKTGNVPAERIDRSVRFSMCGVN